MHATASTDTSVVKLKLMLRVLPWEYTNKKVNLRSRLLVAVFLADLYSRPKMRCNKRESPPNSLRNMYLLIVSSKIRVLVNCSDTDGITFDVSHDNPSLKRLCSRHAVPNPWQTAMGWT